MPYKPPMWLPSTAEVSSTLSSAENRPYLYKELWNSNDHWPLSLTFSPCLLVQIVAIRLVNSDCHVILLLSQICPWDLLAICFPVAKHCKVSWPCKGYNHYDRADTSWWHWQLLPLMSPAIAAMPFKNLFTATSCCAFSLHCHHHALGLPSCMLYAE